MDTPTSVELIRVIERQEGGEWFFEASDEIKAFSRAESIIALLHQRYCIEKEEPDGPCLCTLTYGDHTCPDHKYLEELTKHDEYSCPKAAKVFIQRISTRGIVEIRC